MEERNSQCLRYIALPSFQFLQREVSVGISHVASQMLHPLHVKLES